MRSIAVACGVALALSACTVDLGGTAFVNDKTASASTRVSSEKAVLGPDGRCEADVSVDPSLLGNRPQQVDLGISECDLVRLKGQPTDVLIGDSGKGQREVQVLYQEPTGKKLYLFSDNKLERIVE